VRILDAILNQVHKNNKLGNKASQSHKQTLMKLY